MRVAMIKIPREAIDFEQVQIKFCAMSGHHL